MRAAFNWTFTLFSRFFFIVVLIDMFHSELIILISLFGPIRRKLLTFTDFKRFIVDANISFAIIAHHLFVFIFIVYCVYLDWNEHSYFFDE